MGNGVSVDLAELIALKRFARKIAYKPERASNGVGNHLSKFRGRGMDFSEVRNYQAGDEIRHMEWRVTARTGRPHIKLYQEERERPVVIVTDFNPSMYFGTRKAFKSVVAARLAALIAWTTVKQGDKIGALLYSSARHNEFIPRAREAGVLPILASLMDYTNQVDEMMSDHSPLPLSEGLLRLRRVVKPGSIIVLISDFYHLNQDAEKHLSRLHEHNDILAYHICDPLELSSPVPALYAMTDGRQELLLDTANTQVKADYQQWCDQRQAALQSVFKRLHIQYVQLSGENDIAQVIYQTFPRRKHD
ncbi:hypothetical protein Lbir_1832 [Legionella birminghamensis]|uniref:Uncharacterized conserved protein (Some members contain a von Willebrand factor type A (VWA) domain) n=1 Tax=Legionella birminghamensis TaxID=28083 RepID=A0A378I5P3_9GAMM|nr:DUF58 domain-containing protein [Legionella birminghamensis]KTC70249.1 hypothetical protein Lbir_1832 [Legionella birminghamensis]STX30343.1 Uncharacterized conserved protein (some members contain a von Willebrand factor type A (vWA) domain) [Legionella birminghamensis]